MDEQIATWTKQLRRGRLLTGGISVSADSRNPTRLLPHRGSMLLLDEVVAVDVAAGRIRAERVVSPDDPIFTGHFPSQPVYPGVLLIEMMAQAALAALPFLRLGSAAIPLAYVPPAVRFTRVRDAAFLAPVGPGDRLVVHAEAADDGLLVHALGQVYSGDVLCAYAISEALLDE